LEKPELAFPVSEFIKTAGIPSKQLAHLTRTAKTQELYAISGEEFLGLGMGLKQRWMNVCTMNLRLIQSLNLRLIQSLNL